MFLPTLMNAFFAFRGESSVHAARIGQWQGDESKSWLLVNEYFISA
jgi:hypothetical protein